MGNNKYEFLLSSYICKALFQVFYLLMHLILTIPLCHRYCNLSCFTDVDVGAQGGQITYSRSVSGRAEIQTTRAYASLLPQNPVLSDIHTIFCLHDSVLKEMQNTSSIHSWPQLLYRYDRFLKGPYLRVGSWHKIHKLLRWILLQTLIS